MTQKNMIELLLHSNLVSQDMINEATFYQNSHDCGILQYLVWKGHLNDDDLARIMSTQFGFPYVTLEDDVIPDEVIAVIPVAVAKKYLVLPVDRSGNDLTVFMVNPFDDEAISEIEKISGCKVQKFVGVLSDILNAIEKYYKVTITEKLVKEKAQDTRFKPLPPVPDTAGAGNDEPVTGDGGEHLLNIPGMDLDIENHDDEPREETAKEPEPEDDPSLFPEKVKALLVSENELRENVVATSRELDKFINIMSETNNRLKGKKPESL